MPLRPNKYECKMKKNSKTDIIIIVSCKIYFQYIDKIIKLKSNINIFCMYF